MGQYWLLVNLDKREFVDPHKVASGLKLWEQLANHPGTGAAMIILCAAMPQPRGGGDFDLSNEESNPEYQEIAERTVGRWAGDRIALVGDYAEDTDLPKKFHASTIYNLCRASEDGTEELLWNYRNRLLNLERNGGDIAQIEQIKSQIAYIRRTTSYTDISEDVCAVIEHELGGHFTAGPGWRDFKYESR